VSPEEAALSAAKIVVCVLPPSASTVLVVAKEVEEMKKNDRDIQITKLRFCLKRIFRNRNRINTTYPAFR
jgi:hypothetical protein